MQRRFFLDVIIRKSAAVLQLLSSENQSLLVWRNSFFVLNLRLHVVNSITRLDVQRDSFTRERLDENLHPPTQAQHQMQRRFFLDVIIRKSAAVLQLLSSENQSLLVWRDTFFVLNLRLHVVNSITR